MDKAEDNPVESAADKKFGPDSHLTDDLLLLAVDGELSAGEAANVRAHLEACWSCRVRQEQIEEAIAGVVEYRNRLVKPYLPPPASGRRMFLALLEQLANEIGRPTLWRRLVGGFRSVLATAVPTRPAWITALVMAGLALFFLARLRESPIVSASELLQRVQASEVAALRSVSQPAVYQKLRIRAGSHTVTRTIYRDPEGKRQADHLDVSSAKEAELQRVFQVARLSWRDPLSAASYSAWRNSLSEKQEEVTRDGEDHLTLKTTTLDGPISEVRLTVRAADYHPIAENLRFKDDSQIEITELAYEVLNLEAINPAIFAPETPALSPIPQPTHTVAPVPSEAELAEAELQARLALHVTQADLGEPIEVLRNAHGLVVLHGLASTAERKNELLAALRGIPHVDARLRTVDEAAAERRLETPASAPVAISVEAMPALQKALEKHFPKPEERATFVNQALGLAQDAMAHAWALRRLKERYAPQEIALLSRSSQQTLELVIRDHVAALRERVDAERKLIAPLLPLVQTDEQGSAPPAADWGTALTQIFPAVQGMQGEISILFAGSGEANADPEALTRELQWILQELGTELPELYQLVSGPFLKPRQENP